MLKRLFSKGVVVASLTTATPALAAPPTRGTVICSSASLSASPSGALPPASCTLSYYRDPDGGQMGLAIVQNTCGPGVAVSFTASGAAGGTGQLSGTLDAGVAGSCSFRVVPSDGTDHMTSGAAVSVYLPQVTVQSPALASGDAGGAPKTFQVVATSAGQPVAGATFECEPLAPTAICPAELSLDAATGQASYALSTVGSHRVRFRAVVGARSYPAQAAMTLTTLSPAQSSELAEAASPVEVLEVTSTTADAAYPPGAAIDVSVRFEAPVRVTNTKNLKVRMETGSIDREATYLSGSGTATLRFRYVVQAGDESADLDSSAILAAPGSLSAAAGPRSVSTSIPAGKSLADSKSIQVGQAAAAKPVAAFDTPADLLLSASELSAVALSGGCSDVGGSVILKRHGNKAALAEAPCSAGAHALGGVWSASVDVSSAADGLISLSATHVTRAGATSVAASLSLTKDTSPPSPRVTLPSSSFFRSSAATGSFGGSCEQGLPVSVALDAGSAQTVSCPAGTWQASLPLSGVALGASFTVAVSQTDAAGNVGPGSRSFTRLSGPVFSSFPLVGVAADGFLNASEIGASSALAGSLAGQNFSEARYRLAAAASDCALVTGYGLAIPTVQAVAADGDYKVCVELKDIEQTTVYGASPPFTRDAIAPTIDAFELAGVAADGVVTAAESSDASAVVSVSASGHSKLEYGVRNSAGACAAEDTVYALSAPRASDLYGGGTKLLCVRATDAAGNAAHGPQLSVLADTTGPAAPAFGTLGPITAANASAYTVSGTCSEAGELLSLQATLNGAPQPLSGQPSTSDIPCNSGAWSASVNLSSGGDGSVVLSLSSVDAGGNPNVGGPVSSPSLTKDVTAPAFTLPGGREGQGTLTYSLSSGNLSGVCPHTASPGNTIITIASSVNGWVTDPCVAGGTYGFTGATNPRYSNVKLVYALRVDAQGAESFVDAYSVSNTAFTAFRQPDGSVSGTCVSGHTISFLKNPAGELASTVTCAAGSYSLGSALASDVVIALAYSSPSRSQASIVDGRWVRPVPPAISLAGAASDGKINASEAFSSSPIVSFSATGHTAAAYAVVAPQATCGALVNFSLSSAPTAADVSDDGNSKVCVRISDGVNPAAYASSATITRDGIAPTIQHVSMSSGAADDQYINLSEVADAREMAVAEAYDHDSLAYALIEQDAACDASTPGFATTSPRAVDVGADGNYRICARASDDAGNTPAYMTTGSFTRDTVAPVIQEVVLGGAVLDGYISYFEMSHADALASASATGHDTLSYAAIGKNEACDAFTPFSAAAPRPVDVSVDGEFRVCVMASDAAGNPAHFKFSDVFKRDTAGPAISAVYLNDNVINISESTGTTPLVSWEASGHDSLAYSIIAGAAMCGEASGPFSATVPRAIDVLSDGTYRICIRASDAAGNADSFLASSTFIRDTVAPAISLIELAGAATNGSINFGERNNPIGLTVTTATGHDALRYALIPSTGACDASVTFVTSIPMASTVTTDGSYKICVRANDNAGNQAAYLASPTFTRDIVAPTISSVSLAGPAADLYVNLADSTDQGPLATVSASGHDSLGYAVISGAATCNATATFSAVSPKISDLAADGGFKLCVRASDAAGNTDAYLASAAFTRDTVPPSVQSITLSGVADDGFVNDAEKSSVAELVTVSASGHDQIAYAVIASAAACDGTTPFPLSAVPTAVALATDGSYRVCARLTDIANNAPAHAASAVIKRDTVITTPIVGLLGAASDGTINASDTVNPNPVAQVSNLDSDATASYVLLPTASTCAPTLTLGDGSAAIAGTAFQGLADGSYRICAIAQDLAGNKAVASSGSISSDVTPPGAFSITPATNISTSAGSKTVTWTASSGTAGYQIYAASDKACATTFHTASAAAAATSSSISFAAGNSYVCISSSDAAGNIRWASNAEPTTSPYAVQVQQDNILGQPNATTVTHKMYTWGAASTLGVEVFGSKLYVADSPNNRVLIYNWPLTQTNPAPIEVLGQPDFVSSIANNNGTTLDGLPCAKCLSGPGTLAIQASGSTPQYLWVADRNNARILRYALTSATGLPTGGRHAAADLVLGAASLTTAGTSACDATSVSGRSVAIANGKLFVGDVSNNRVLVYNTIPTTNNAAANHVLGQTSLTNCSSFTGAANSTTFQMSNIAADSTYLYVGSNGLNRVVAFNVSGTITNGMAASYVLGQSSFTGSTGGSGNLMTQPYGIWSSASNPYVFVGDFGNKRVLAYTKSSFAAGLNIPAFQLGDGTSSKTAPTSSMIGMPVAIAGDANGMIIVDAFINRATVYDAPATSGSDLPTKVIGLPSLTSPSSGPTLANAFAWGTSETSGDGAPPGACVMKNMLFAPDTASHRVLVWSPVPASAMESASYVLGQPNFTSKASGSSATALTDPVSVYCDEANQKLYVVEMTAHRIKVYDLAGGVSTNMAASFVLGQTSFSGSASATRSASTLSNPRGIWGDSTRLWVADFSGHRVLGYTLPISSNGQAASVVVGQQNFTDNQQVTTIDSLRGPMGGFSDGTRLYVADRNANRIMIWNLSGLVTTGGADASMVLGQTSFTAVVSPTTPSQSNLREPVGVFVDAGKIYAVDSNFNRIMIWNTLPATVGSNPASSQFGHSNFTTANELTTGASSLSDPRQVFKSGNYWYVVDRGNRRILQKTTFP